MSKNKKICSVCLKVIPANVDWSQNCFNQYECGICENELLDGASPTPDELQHIFG